MTSTGAQTDRRTGRRAQRLRRWVAGGAVAATLTLTGLVAAAPAHAVSLPGRCDVNAGVWTCLP